MDNRLSLYNDAEQTSSEYTSYRGSGIKSYLPRKKVAFRCLTWLYKFRTWHSGILRHVGFYRKRPPKVDATEHAIDVLSGLSELLKLVVGACFFQPPINPSPHPFLSNGYESFRAMGSVDRLHMHLHDLTSEIDPMLVRTKSTCPLCAMLNAYYVIIHSGVAKTWGHPMTWCGMATAHRSGLFLTGLFRSTMQQSDDLELDPLNFARLERCYELLVHLLYCKRSGVK